MNTVALSAAATLAVLASVATPRSGVAQQSFRFGLTGMVGLYETHRIEPDGELRLRGPVAGGEGVAAWGPLIMRVGYAEGWLDAEPGIVFERNFVEGYVLVGGTPLPGLEISVGPHARSIISDGTSRPSWFGEAHVRYEAPIAPPILAATFEGWGSLLGETSERESLSTLHGGSVGVALRPTGGRLLLRLTYGLDEARFDAGPRRRTVDVLSFTFGYGLP